MRRHAHRQLMGFIRPLLQRAFCHLRHSLIGTGNHNLRFRIQVGDITARVEDQTLDLRQVQTHDSRQAVAVRIRLFHQITAQCHQP
ncbi:hypothetical protein D3C86_1610300 [compost metagenome]